MTHGYFVRRFVTPAIFFASPFGIFFDRPPTFAACLRVMVFFAIGSITATSG